MEGGDNKQGNDGQGAAAKPSASGGDGGFDSIELPAFEQPPQDGGDGQGAGDGQGTQDGQGAPPAPPKLLAGRFKAVEELEKAYESSGQEGRRLYELAQKHEQGLTKSQARIAELEAEIARRPPLFKVLSPEEEAKLKGEDQAGYMKYLFEKRDHEQGEKEHKRALQERQELEERGKREAADHLETRHRTMLSDPKKYPRYGELLGVMENMLERVPALRGQKDAADLLYLAAYGATAKAAATKAALTEKASGEDAAAQAAALAARTAPPGSGSSKLPGGKMDDFNTRLVNAGKRIALPNF